MITSFRGHWNLWMGLFVIYHDPNNSCDQNHRDSGDLMFLICHVISGEKMLKELYKLVP